MGTSHLPCHWWVFGECRRFGVLTKDDRVICCPDHQDVIHIDHKGRGYTLNGYWYKFR